MPQYPIDVPPLVQEAKALALQLGFDLRPDGNAAGSLPASASCCIDEVGSLLRTLAGAVTQGKVGEIGTGAGVGTAWLASGLREGVDLISVELEARLASATSDLFQPLPQVNILSGDWRESFVQHGPFQLLFADGGGVGSAAADQWPVFGSLLVSGGVMVIDDLTPEALWPEAWKGKPDAKREFAFNSGFFHATEVLSRPDISTLVLVKR